MEIQQLGLCASTTGGVGLIPGRRELRSRMPHSVAKKKKKFEGISEKSLYFVYDFSYLLIKAFSGILRRTFYSNVFF